MSAVPQVPNPLRENIPPIQLQEKMRYSNVLPKVFPSKVSINQFTPTNGSSFTYTNARTIQINIDGPFFVDLRHSYLKFTLTNKSTENISGDAVPVFLDHGATCIIRDYELYTGQGKLIDRHLNENVLKATLSDWNHSMAWKHTIGEAVSGYASLAQIDGSGTPTANPNHDWFQTGLGFEKSREFAVPLLGFLSMDKYLPLKFIKQGLRIVINLEDPALAMFTSTIPTHTLRYEVTNVAYVARCLTFSPEFDASFQSLMLDETAPMVQFHSPTWLHSSYYANSTKYTVPLSERARSIKSIIAVQRADDQFFSTQQSLSAHGRFGVNSYRLKIGSEYVPNDKPYTVSESEYIDAFMGTLMAFGTSGKADVSGNSLTARNYLAHGHTYATDAQPTVNGVPRAEMYGRFTMAFDLESYSGLLAESGVDTSSRSTDIDLIVSRGADYLDPFTLSAETPITTPAVLVDVYMLVDQVITLLPDGSVSVSS